MNLIETAVSFVWGKKRGEYFGRNSFFLYLQSKLWQMLMVNSQVLKDPVAIADSDIQIACIHAFFHCHTFCRVRTVVWKLPMISFYLSVKPTSVSILEKPGHVSADRELEIVCQAVGGYPPPKLTWWLGSKMLRPDDEVSYTGSSS